jgi:hypothetical protein
MLNSALPHTALTKKIIFNNMKKKTDITKPKISFTVIQIEIATVHAMRSRGLIEA